VLSIDAKKDGDEYYVYTHGGRQKTTLKVIDWALQGVALGAGELVLNTMDTDGEQNTTRRLSKRFQTAFQSL